jgi:hypothetical protein
MRAGMRDGKSSGKSECAMDESANAWEVEVQEVQQEPWLSGASECSSHYGRANLALWV